MAAKAVEAIVTIVSGLSDLEIEISLRRIQSWFFNRGNGEIQKIFCCLRTLLSMNELSSLPTARRSCLM